jgi:hypothetical protein
MPKATCFRRMSSRACPSGSGWIRFGERFETLRVGACFAFHTVPVLKQSARCAAFSGQGQGSPPLSRQRGPCPVDCDSQLDDGGCGKGGVTIFRRLAIDTRLASKTGPIWNRPREGLSCWLFSVFFHDPLQIPALLQTEKSFDKVKSISEPTLREIDTLSTSMYVLFYLPYCLRHLLHMVCASTFSAVT